VAILNVGHASIMSVIRGCQAFEDLLVKYSDPFAAKMTSNEEKIADYREGVRLGNLLSRIG
jgi:hypothetical protein